METTEVVISSEVLYKKLLKICSVIENKPLVLALGDFLFEMHKEKLVITASDVNTTMSVDLFLGEDYGEFAIAIPADILIDTLKNLPSQPIKMIFNIEKNFVQIVSNTGKYKILCDNASDFKVVNKVGSGDGDFSVMLSADVVLEAIEKVIVISGESTVSLVNPCINRVLFEVENGSFSAVATDSKRLIKYCGKVDIKCDYKRFLVQRKALSFLANNIDKGENVGMFTYSEDNGEGDKNRYLCVKGDSFLWVSLLSDGRYPSYERIIPEGYKNEMVINRDEIISAVKRLIIFERGKNVKFVVNNDFLNIVADDKGDCFNSAEEKIGCSYVGEIGLEVFFNLKYILTILQVMDCEDVKFLFPNVEDGKCCYKVCEILPVKKENDNSDVLALIMPML